jgi:drug/metabolite transporter (DMT)-like permease
MNDARARVGAGVGAAAAALMTAQPFATKLSQNESGEYDYFVLTTVLCCECLKLAVSSACYALRPGKTHSLLTRREIAAFCVPAAIYALNNALVFAIVSSIRPSAFQVISTSKTLFTVVLFRIVLRRVPTTSQYLSVVLLAAGAAVSRLSCDGGAEGSDSSKETIGVALTLVSCIASSLGGVSNEFLLKKDGEIHSLALQNSILYAWGVAVNALALAIRNRDAFFDFFRGYDLGVVLLILCNSATGLSISAVLKWADNLTRVYAHVCAMVLSAALESAVLGSLPPLSLVLAAIVVSCSVAIYSQDPPPKARTASPQLLNHQTFPPPSEA